MQPDKFVGMKIGSTITICRYDPAWVEEFERVRTELEAACGNSIFTVNHVGSTSVPGLDAKPIIDILVGVEDLERSLELSPILESLGFVYRPDDELPDRHYCPRTIRGLRRHHVSLAEPKSRHYINTLAFRDALRRNEELANQYSSLKKRLAAEVGKNRISYLNGKTAFILNTLKNEGFETGGNYPVQFGVGPI